MVERQQEFFINKTNELEVLDPQWGLPPRPLRWPTAEELRAAAAEEPDPREELKELRRKVPLAGPRTWGLRIQKAG